MSRHPGPVERLYLYRIATGTGTGGFSVAVQLNKPIDNVLLSHALRRLLLKESSFVLNFKRTSGDDAKSNYKNFVAEPVPQVLYSDVVQHEKIHQFDDAFLHYLQTIKIQVDTQKPTWKVLLVDADLEQCQWLVFVNNHILFDGTSGMNAVDDLVACLNEESQKNHEKPLDLLYNHSQDATGPVKPHSGTSGIYNALWPFLLKTFVVEVMLPSWLTKVVRSLLSPGWPNLFKFPPFAAVPPKRKETNGFRMVRLGPEQLKQLVANAKLHNLTVTPFIAACCATAARASLVPYKRDPCSLGICVDIDGRRLVSGGRYGLFMLGLSCLLPPADLHSSGVTVAKALKEAFITKNPFQQAGLLAYLNIPAYFDGVYNDKNGRVFAEVLNLGVRTISHGCFSAEKIVFTQGVNTNHVTLSSVTCNGSVAIVVSYTSELDLWDNGGVMARFVEVFTECLTSGLHIPLE